MSKISKEKQRELVITAQNGDISALHALIYEFINYIRFIADKNISFYTNQGIKISIEEVYHEGIFGLIDAVGKYKTDSQAAFSIILYLPTAFKGKAPISA